MLACEQCLHFFSIRATRIRLILFLNSLRLLIDEEGKMWDNQMDKQVAKRFSLQLNK